MQLTCPKCQGSMRQYERSSVHVDQCTECRGIFLDRGELERLIDAETSFHGGAPPAPAPAYDRSREQYGYDRDHDRGHERDYDRGHDRRPDQYGYGQRKKRKSFFEELFD